MLDCLKKVNGKKLGVFAAGVALVLQVSKYYPAKMQRSFIQIVQQPFFVLRSVC